MAHFAQINGDNVVYRVIVVSNNDCGGGEFPESEPIGQTFIAGLGLQGTWLQTSYSGSFRSQYAGIGDVYVAATNEFVTPVNNETE